MRRSLHVTDHAFDQYVNRILVGECRGVLAKIQADFAGARCVPKADRWMMARGSKWDDYGAAYFHNPETEAVFVCEPLSAREFRLITCFLREGAPRRAARESQLRHAS
jgi:hypothetical protein